MCHHYNLILRAMCQKGALMEAREFHRKNSDYCEGEISDDRMVFQARKLFSDNVREELQKEVKDYQKKMDELLQGVLKELEKDSPQSVWPAFGILARWYREEFSIFYPLYNVVSGNRTLPRLSDEPERFGNGMEWFVVTVTIYA